MCYAVHMNSNPTALSPTDQARLEVACQDQAHTHHGFGEGSAASYVADTLHEGTLSDYPYHLIHDAVGKYLADHPDVLTYTDEQVRQNQRDRAAASQTAAGKASSKWLAGFPTEALAVIDEAETLNPDHPVDGLYSWDRLRNVIDTQEPDEVA